MQHLRLLYNGEVCLRHKNAGLTCLGHPGRCKTKRNDPIFIALPRQVKLSFSWYKNTNSFAEKLCLLKWGFNDCYLCASILLPIIRNLYSFKGSHVNKYVFIWFLQKIEIILNILKIAVKHLKFKKLPCFVSICIFVTMEKKLARL
jgi:hypothetical protein